MQLKIKINVSKEPTSPPEPAPFDPVKIRNFLLLTITTLSLIGFGGYRMWDEEPKPTLPSALNLPSNSLSNSETLASATLNEEDTLANKVDRIATNNTENDASTNAIHTEISQNNIASKKAVEKTQTINTAIKNNSNKTSTTETTLTIISDLSETDKPESVATTEAILKEKTEIESQSAINVTPTVVDNVVEKKSDLLTSNQATNKVVHRAQLTSKILSREPSDNIEHLNLQEQNKLYFFTEIHGKNNQKIYHRWIFKKKLIAEITLNIKNEQWRTYSSKNFDETMVGQWEVQVVDQDDNILKTVTFEVSR